MANQSNSRRQSQTEIELALLQTLLDENTAYPWDPALADAYYQQAAKAGEALEISADDAAQGWQAMSNQLNQLWGSNTVSLKDVLCQKFAGRLSAGLIDHISQSAQQVVENGRPLAEQLIACVRDSLTGWDDADLQVMARPLAYAMRGQSEILDVTIASVRNAEWDSLSAMEQARLSLAAARYAIDYLKEEQQ